MCGFNPDKFPDSNSIPVCAKCFGDGGIFQFIEDFGDPPGCPFYKRSDSPTAPLDKVCDYMRECLLEFFEFAIDRLPYDSRHRGYLFQHWNTFELLYDELDLDLPRDWDERLWSMLPYRISEEVWCKRDWLSLDYKVMLEPSWEKFCRMIQHERRTKVHIG